MVSSGADAATTPDERMMVGPNCATLEERIRGREIVLLAFGAMRLSHRMRGYTNRAFNTWDFVADGGTTGAVLVLANRQTFLNNLAVLPAISHLTSNIGFKHRPTIGAQQQVLPPLSPALFAFLGDHQKGRERAKLCCVSPRTLVVSHDNPSL